MSGFAQIGRSYLELLDIQSELNRIRGELNQIRDQKALDRLNPKLNEIERSMQNGLTDSMFVRYSNGNLEIL